MRHAHIRLPVRVVLRANGRFFRGVRGLMMAQPAYRLPFQSSQLQFSWPLATVTLQSRLTLWRRRYATLRKVCNIGSVQTGLYWLSDKHGKIVSHKINMFLVESLRFQLPYQKETTTFKNQCREKKETQNKSLSLVQMHARDLMCT